MKNLIKIFILFIPAITIAQSQIHVQAGFKAIEVGYTHQDEDLLNFGVSVSAVDADIVEKRANRNDTSKSVHTLNSDVVPAVFGTVGGTFDNFTITGKMGAAYLNQSINNIADAQKIYWGVGVRFNYTFDNNLSLVGGYDNIKSGMLGIAFNLE